MTCAALALTACAATPPAEDAPADTAPLEFSSPSAALNYHLLMGEIAMSREQFDEAADAYLAAMPLADDAGVAERAAQLTLHAGRLDDARSAAARWRALEPAASGPSEVELVVALRADDAQLAYRHAEELLERWHAPHEAAFQGLGRLLVDEAELDPSIQLMQRLTERYNVAPAWQVLGLLALRAEKHAIARTAAERARLLDPESPQAALLEARVLVTMGEGERGLALMRATVAEHPDDPTLRFALAGLYLALQDYTDATNELEQVVAQAPAYTDARWMLAMVLLQTGEVDGAEQHLRELLADPVRRWDVPYYLGGVYESREDWDAALEWFDQVEWGDNLLNARIKAVQMLWLLGREDDARTRLGHMQADFPRQSARLHRVEAELLNRAGRPTDAIAVYDRALLHAPDDVSLLYARALQHERVGDFDAAVADLRRVYTLDPDNAVAQNALGYLLADHGEPSDWDEARALIALAVAQEPTNAAFLDSMGWVLYRLGDLEAARDWLLRSWQAQRDAEVGAHLGEVFWHLDQREAAREVWLDALRLDAEHPDLIETLERLEADVRGHDRP